MIKVSVPPRLAAEMHSRTFRNIVSPFETLLRSRARNLERHHAAKAARHLPACEFVLGML